MAWGKRQRIASRAITEGDLDLAADPAADVAVEEPSSERVTTANGRFMAAELGRGSLALELDTEVAELARAICSVPREGIASSRAVAKHLTTVPMPQVGHQMWGILSIRK